MQAILFTFTVKGHPGFHNIIIYGQDYDRMLTQAKFRVAGILIAPKRDVILSHEAVVEIDYGVYIKS